MIEPTADDIRRAETAMERRRAIDDCPHLALDEPDAPLSPPWLIIASALAVLLVLWIGYVG